MDLSLYVVNFVVDFIVSEKGISGIRSEVLHVTVVVRYVHKHLYVRRLHGRIVFTSNS